MAKPRVLILGGVGFIGRNLVKYIVENNLASKVRVADKVLPEMASLSSTFAPSFQSVEFVQANLVSAESVKKVFTDPEGAYNIVINLAAETKLSLQPAAYHEGIVTLSQRVAQEAVLHNVERFIQVSTAHVYKAGNKPKTEGDETEPWTQVATASLDAEKELKNIKGLPLIIVRPAIVYGTSDIYGIAPRLVIAAVYKKTGKAMKFLWTGDLRINTVHVKDVVRALWHLSSNGELGKIYNLADKNDTDQLKINQLIEKIFGIKTGFKSKITSQLTKVALGAVTEEVNSRHIEPWAQITKENSIAYSKLTPYLDEELLSNNGLAVDGSAIEKTGFVYEVPKVTEEIIRETIAEYVRSEWFPSNLV